jgi:hypothetical protein
MRSSEGKKAFSGGKHAGTMGKRIWISGSQAPIMLRFGVFVGIRQVSHLQHDRKIPLHMRNISAALRAARRSFARGQPR